MIFNIVKRAIKPFRLISLVTTYALGAGLVQYVRGIRSWSILLQGGFFLLLIALSVEFLRLLHALTDVRQWPEGMVRGDMQRARLVIGMGTATLLTVAATIFTSWMLREVLRQGVIILVIVMIAVSVLYYLTQMLTSLRAFQIPVETLMFVIVPPAFAYFLQSAQLHRLLTLSMVGLVSSYMAYRVQAQLQRFSQDLKLGVRTLVTEMGWENAMFLHNVLILLTYLLFGIIVLIGFPWFLLWPVFLTLPIGLLQVWLMERVRRGGKPLWRVMTFASASVFLLPVYLISFAFWIR